MSKREFSAIVFIFVVAIFLRTIFIDRIPVGLNNDELSYLLNSKAVFYGFSDLSQKWNPLTLSTPPEEYRGITPFILFAPIIGILNSSLFLSKIPYLITSVLFVFVIFWLSKYFFGTKAGLFGALIAAINPWAIFIGRTAFEAPVGMTLFYLSALMILKLKGSKILWTIPILLLAFYSYMGLNILLIPFVLALLIYRWNMDRTKGTVVGLFSVAFFIAILSLFYIFNLQHSGASTRLNEITTPSSPVFSRQVDDDRRKSIVSQLNSIYINKYVIFGQFLVDKYLGAFSPKLLFTIGDPNTLYSLSKHGLFYLSDSVFLLVGIYFVWLKYRKTAYLFSAIMLISPLPAAISSAGSQYVFRASLLYPIFIILIGVGLSRLTLIINKSKALILLIFLVYGIQITNFMHAYLYQTPIANEQSFISYRILSRLLKEENIAGNKTLVILSEPKSAYEQFLFYNNLYSSNSKNIIAKALQDKVYKYENIEFSQCGNLHNELYDHVVVDRLSMNCQKLISPKTNYKILPQLSDSGTQYYLFNQTTCKDVKLSTYVSDLTISDFRIEDLNKDSFCRKYIIEPLAN